MKKEKKNQDFGRRKAQMKHIDLLEARTRLTHTNSGESWETTSNILRGSSTKLMVLSRRGEWGAKYRVTRRLLMEEWGPRALPLALGYPTPGRVESGLSRSQAGMKHRFTWAMVQPPQLVSSEPESGSPTQAGIIYPPDKRLSSAQRNLTCSRARCLYRSPDVNQDGPTTLRQLLTSPPRYTGHFTTLTRLTMGRAPSPQLLARKVEECGQNHQV